VCWDEAHERYRDGVRLKIYSDQDEGASVSLRSGETFEIRLSENPTTGYRWQLADWDRTVLDIRRDEFRPPGTAERGVGGKHVWEIAARAPGRTSLRLGYSRSWESGSPARTFSLDVSVS
jgi:inhibitor of cysteine peptidase